MEFLLGERTEQALQSGRLAENFKEFFDTVLMPDVEDRLINKLKHATSPLSHEEMILIQGTFKALGMLESGITGIIANKIETKKEVLNNARGL
jgi:hypothetical protein